MTTGAKIRKKRIEIGYSQEFLAEKLGISQATLSNIESDKSILDINTLQNISRELKIGIQDLLNSEKVVINNVETNNGIGYAEIVNQLFDKIVEQYELRIQDLQMQNLELKQRLSKFEQN